MKEFYENALNLLFPIDELCMFCEKRKKLYRHYLCEDCYQSLDQDFYSCKYCGLAMQDRSFYVCEDCTKYRDFDGFVKGYRLSPLGKKAVYRYKNGRKRELSYCFSSIMEERIRETLNLKDIDFIVPVPSSSKKLRKRGFDHIDEIVKKLSEKLEIEKMDFLEKTHEVREQKKLNKFERLENMKEVFVLKKYTDVPISILLVDDILTTGATMKACSKVLKELNAKVYGACVFHTANVFLTDD